MRRSRAALGAWILRGVASVLLAFTFVYVPWYLYAWSGLGRYLGLRADLVDLRAKNAHLRTENRRLARQAEQLRYDLRAVEAVARTELGWIRQGEIVFDLGSQGAAALGYEGP